MAQIKLLLLSQNSGTWRAEERPEWRRFQSGFEAWAFCPGVEATYCNGNDATLDLVNAHDIVMAGPGDITDEALDVLPALLKLQAARNSKVKWVTMLDDIRSVKEPGYAIVELLEGSDLINVLNRNTLDFLQSLTGTRCEYIGIPYPAKEIREDNLAGSRQQMFMKQNAWGEHSILPSLAACETCSPDTEIRGQQEHLANLSQHGFAFMNLEERYTWGRNVLDCAALQIPCITTRATYHGSIFFPQLVVPDEFCISEARALFRRLRTDDGFYCRVTDVPIELFDEYTHVAMWGKLMKGLQNAE